MYSFRNILYTILGMSGFIINHLNAGQVALMGGSLLFSIFILPTYSTVTQAVGYFIGTMVFYLGLISLVLPKAGLRLNWIKACGEDKAYRQFERVLAFAFFHNALGLSHVSQSTLHTGFWGSIPPIALYTLVGFMLLVGISIKIWSALVVGLPIYYWKDMFVGRPVSAFVVSGPYKYLSNPMYGLGQLQVYAIVLYYDSTYGLICGLLNQSLLFGFYYTVERPFIQRVYTHEG